MAIDFSFLENAAPKQPEPEPVKASSGMANVTIRVDADSILECDGEYIDLPLKAGVMAKTQLPVGQHLLVFTSQENPNVKVEKVVDFPEADKNYLVMVNELKMQLAPAMPQMQQPQMPPQNAFLDQLNRMAQMNPLAGMSMPQMPGSMPQMPGMQPQMPPMPGTENKK